MIESNIQTGPGGGGHVGWYGTLDYSSINGALIAY